MLTIDAAEALIALWELREDNRVMLAELANDGPAIHRTAAWITLALSDRLSANAPYLTGTLASAHRGTAKENEGLLFVDPDVINPVFNGKPALYGEEVHLEKPWWTSTIESDGDQILVEGLLLLETEMDELWT
ncbi:MAG: hypothetical protein IAF02_20075 [Anaerolineae bacterium]|nr:hypothetical protein [Anaerolineae bacterium]